MHFCHKPLEFFDFIGGNIGFLGQIFPINTQELGYETFIPQILPP